MFTRENNILFIGAASLDTYHIADKVIDSPGGAGLYASLAAARMGSKATMIGPRLKPLPDVFKQALERVRWIGPATTLDHFCHFEIDYKNGKTTYLEYDVSAEAILNPADLPDDLATFDAIHITALASVGQQLEFLQACREKTSAIISAGTCWHDICAEPDLVRGLQSLADVFFMNSKEAEALFGSIENAKTKPGALLLITMGKKGALVVQGDFVTEIPAAAAKEFDPTGAGDTFCGATLAGILQGHHPIMAAHQAAVLSAHMIGALGPTGLLDDAAIDFLKIDPRVRINHEQIDRIANQISILPAIAPHDFLEPCLPPEGHPGMLDFIFTTTLQQFSFWETANNQYDRPLLASLDGIISKGAEYLWRAYMRKLDTHPEFFLPAYQVEMKETELADLFSADDGTNPMPAFELHYELAKSYANDMLALNLTPRKIVDIANQSSTPIQSLLELLDKISGYKEDPLRKKSNLLAEILINRPEQFLKPGSQESLAPIVDYHNMRACLRTGLVECIDLDLNSSIAQRKLIEPEDEWAVRFACYLAIEDCAAISGKGVEGVGQFFFNSRKYCPEMTKPNCANCLIDPVCKHQIELFQPVLRTTFY